jgi:hypothetical protein
MDSGHTATCSQWRENTCSTLPSGRQQSSQTLAILVPPVPVSTARKSLFANLLIHKLPSTVVSQFLSLNTHIL